MGKYLKLSFPFNGVILSPFNYHQLTIRYKCLCSLLLGLICKLKVFLSRIHVLINIIIFIEFKALYTM